MRHKKIKVSKDRYAYVCDCGTATKGSRLIHKEVSHTKGICNNCGFFCFYARISSKNSVHLRPNQDTQFALQPDESKHFNEDWMYV